MTRTSVGIALVLVFAVGLGMGWWLGSGYEGGEHQGPQLWTDPTPSPNPDGSGAASLLEPVSNETTTSLAGDSAQRTPMIPAARIGEFSIKGTVKDATGEPVPPVLLQLKSSTDVREASSSVSGGSYAFEELPGGKYTLHVSSRSWYPFERPLILDGKPRQIVEHVVLDQHQRIAVRVLTPQGEPFLQTRMQIRQLNGEDSARELHVRRGFDLNVVPHDSRYAHMEVKVNHSPERLGTFEREFSRSPEKNGFLGVVTLERRAPLSIGLFFRDVHIVSKPVHPEDKAVTFTVDPVQLGALLGTVRLRLIDDQSREPVQAIVSLGHDNGGSTRSSDPDGSVEFPPLYATNLTLQIRSPDHMWVSMTLEMSRGQDLDLGTLRLSRVEPVRGRVVDVDGVGIAGVEIRYRPLDVPEWSEDLMTLNNRTDLNGAFELRGFPPGRFWIEGWLKDDDSTYPSVLRTQASVFDRRANTEEVILRALPSTKVELLPRKGSRWRSYNLIADGDVEVETGRIRSNGTTVWLLPGNYVVVLTDKDEGKQHVPFTVGTEFMQVMLP